MSRGQTVKTVLFVEPDVILARGYQRALEGAGWQTMHAAHAQAAVDVLESRTPDVLVLELQLVAHGGMEFLAELRSYSDWQRIPVIIHSLVPTRALEGATILQSQLGIVELLYKPTTSLMTLTRAIRQADRQGVPL